MSRCTAIAMEIYWEHILRRPDAPSIEAPFQYRYTTGCGELLAWCVVPGCWTVLYRPGDTAYHPLPLATAEAWYLCWPDSEGCA
jgi:hypothetical protein